MSDEIISCPHCGANARCLYVSDFGLTHPRTGRQVVCSGCGARSGAYGYAEEAIAAWNRRAQPAEEVQPAPEELQAIFRKAVFDQGFAIINRLMKAFTQSEDLRADGDVKAAIHEAMNMAGELTRAARACGYEPPLQTGCSYETWPGCDTQKRPYALPWKKVQPEEVSILNPKAEEGGAS